MAVPTSQSDLGHRGRRIRLANAEEAGIASEILAEAAEWTTQFGHPIWSEEEIRQEKTREAALARALVVGIERRTIAACMQVYDRDPVHWPDDEVPALYVHKMAIRRCAAGTGWLEDLVYWALRQAKQGGAHVLRLDPLPVGPLSDLYARLGFHSAHSEPQLIDGRLLVHMERHLGWRRPRPDVN